MCWGIVRSFGPGGNEGALGEELNLLEYSTCLNAVKAVSFLTRGLLPRQTTHRCSSRGAARSYDPFSTFHRAQPLQYH